jgi:hypothetical protein
VARNSTPERRTGDRRVRQVYHDLDRRKGTGRRTVERESVRRESGEGPGLFAWLLIGFVVLFLVDAYLWQGYYRHAFWVALNADADAIRTWSDDLWR